MKLGRFEIGVDIGGTFTDIVCRERGGALHVLKVPTTRDDPSRAVIAAIGELARRFGISARDIVGFTFIQLLVHIPLVLGLLWLLGMTLAYVPPVMP